MTKNALLVFAKAPIAGHAKTRLIPGIGADAAAATHQKLVLHTLGHLSHLKGWDTLLWCAEDTEHPFFHQCASDFNLTLYLQQGESLGDRMYHAAKSVLKDYGSICIVGTDCPLLQENHIAEALDALALADVVFNPAEDGGYVLIAFKAVEKRFFENIEWGTSEVMNKSLQNIDELGLSVKIMDTLWDIDEPEDLTRAIKQGLFILTSDTH